MAMDSDFGASEQKGRGGLSPQQLVGGGGNNPQRLLHGNRSGEHSQAALPSSFIRWNRLSSLCHNSTKGSQKLLASQTMHTQHFIFLCTHHSICIHTTWVRIHKVHILMHTHNHHCTYTHMHTTPICIHTHMHTTPICILHPYAYYTHMHTTPICILHPYAGTPFYMHTHPMTYLDPSIPTESLTVISCTMRPAACWQLLLLNDSIFLILYLSINKENVCARAHTHTHTRTRTRTRTLFFFLTQSLQPTSCGYKN